MCCLVQPTIIFTAVDGFFINMHDDAGQYKVNIFFTGKKTDTDKALEVAYKKNGLFFYLGYGIKSLDELKKIELDIFENVPVEALFGQGVVDAGKLSADLALSMYGG